MKAALKSIGRPLLGLCVRLLPLSARKKIVVWFGGLSHLRGISWCSMELLKDFASDAPNAYNRFLWSNHLGYAVDYERANDFGPDNLTKTRQMLFAHLAQYLHKAEIALADVRSVFEVGCSAGFMLRYMETEIFTKATQLDGLDIDYYAIERGQIHLEGFGSLVRLFHADMVNTKEILQGSLYDIVLCAGVLMYQTQEGASDVVRTMLNHANRLVVMTDRAHPMLDNKSLCKSVERGDGTLFHNIDDMVAQAGGRVVFRRWEGEKLFGGYSVYFVFAVPLNVCRSSQTTLG